MSTRGAKRKKVGAIKNKRKGVDSSTDGEEDEFFEKFVSPEAKIEHDEVWGKRGLHVERHVEIGHFQQMSWYAKLEERGWLSITSVPGAALKQIVGEFYANLVVNENHCVAYVRGKQFFFNPRKIALQLKLPEPIKKPRYKFRDFGTCASDVVWPDWRVVVECLTASDDVNANKNVILYVDLLQPYQLLSQIVTRNVIPVTHLSTVNAKTCYLMYAIICDMEFCMASTIYDHVVKVKMDKKIGQVLPFGVLITTLCLSEGVEKEPSDTYERRKAPLNRTWFDRSEVQLVRQQQKNSRAAMESQVGDDEEDDIGTRSVSLAERFEVVEERVTDLGLEVEHTGFVQGQVVSRLEHLESAVESLQMTMGTQLHEIKEAQQQFAAQQQEMFDMIRDWTLP